MATLPPVGADLRSVPLLRTKLYIPPIRPEWVSRPGLLERLDAGLQRKLTLVSAPAGFGKTSLLGDWIHHRGGVLPPAGARTPPLQVAWLSLDEGDNDPTHFLTYVVAALQAAVQPLETSIGQAAMSALQSPQPPPVQVLLTTLINELADFPGRIVLVLDDYHLIEAQPVHDALAFLLRHLPPATGPLGGLHLVLVSREDPPLPLARLRARGQLTELRAADLRFTSAEAAAFLNQAMGLDLSAEDVTALETRTEGWIAGLHLAALALQGASMQRREDASDFVRSFAGSHHFVLDYLVEEVLEQQPGDVQLFLLQTAVLDRLTGPLCDALTGQANGRATLEMLDRANLFIVPLDDERRWYRYHHLFADLLRQRLRQAQPERIPTLHGQAIEWYEKNGFTDQAIEHALYAQEFERAADLIEGVADAMWGREQHTRLRRWLARLSDESLSARPHLCVFYAGNLFASGQQDVAEQHLCVAEQAAAELAAIEQVDRMKLLGRIAATRASMASYRSDALGVIPHALQALEYLPKEDRTWRGGAAIALGDAYVYQGQYAQAYKTYLEALETVRATGDVYLLMNVSLKLALTMRAQGKLQQAIDICRQRLQLAQESGMSQTEMAGWLLAIWGEVLAEVGDLDGALAQVQKGIELTEHGRDVAMLTWSYLCLTRVLFSRGEWAAAQEIITETEKIARASTVPPWVTKMMAAWQVRVWLAQDRLSEALEWAQQRGLDPDPQPTYVGTLEYIALARILIAQGRTDETIGLLERLLGPAEAGSHTTRAIEILLLQASAFYAEGEPARAMAPLERALVLAEPGGFVRVFVDEGPSMARLLYDAVSRGIKPEYARKILGGLSDSPSVPVTKPKISKSDILEPLSERELEVLALIAEGLTNPEIAARLYLSVNTVKAHSRNIYGKLGVHSRTRAVARARALGILSSQVSRLRE